MVKYLFVIFLLLGISSNAVGQNGGTFYAASGFGELQSSANAQLSAMGGNGIGIPAQSFINLENPAMQSAIANVVFMANFTYKGYLISSPTDMLYEATGRINNLALAIPIWKFVLSAGYFPYSKSDYLMVTTGDLTETMVKTSANTWTDTYSGLGGVNKIPLSLSVELFKSPQAGALRLGGTFEIIVGAIERIVDIKYFYSVESNYRKRTMDNFNGYGFTGGIGYTTPRGIFQTDDAFTIGGFISIPSTLTASRLQTITYSHNVSNSSSTTTQFIDTIFAKSNMNIQIPLKFGVGISYESTHLLLNANFTMQNWGGFQYLNDATTNAFSLSYRISAGAQYFVNPKVDANFFLKFAYRIGVYYEKTLWSYSGRDIIEYGASIGLGIPMGNSPYSKVNIAFIYSNRGSIDNGLLREDIFRIEAGINFSEKWFLPRRIEN